MNTFKLLKVLLKNFEMIAFEKKKSKVFYLVMAVVTLLIIFIPTAFMIGIISYGMTSSLKEANHLSEGVNFILYCVSAFSFIFSINVILNVFYFSSDIEHILPMPFKQSEIIGAKFFATLINENAIELVLTLSALIGFMVGGSLDFYGAFIILIAIITIPIVPLVYCAILCMLFMYLFRFIKNSDIISKISNVLLILSIIGLLVLVVLLTNFNLDSFTLGLVDSNFMNVMNYIFPHIKPLTLSMSGKPIYLLVYVGIIVVSLVIFFLLAKVLYFKGLNLANNKKKNKNELTFKQSNPNVSYLKKEFKVLFKTPAFLSNCVIINVIWPFFIAILIYLYDKTGNLSSLIDSFKSGNINMQLYFLIGIVITSILISATNSIASSSISREGQSFYYMKLIPISYSNQLDMKALLSIIISYVGLFIYIIIFSAIFSLGVLNCIMYLFISLFSVIFITYLGLFLDTVNPKLVWDDEINALRGNQNVFINMAYAILASGILVLLIFLLTLIDMPLAVSIILSFILIIGSSVLTYLLTHKKGVKNLIRIE